MDSLGKRIKYLREINKVSQKELADVTQISRSNISKIENDTLSPTASSIISLASYFKISTDWLLTGSEHKVVEDLKFKWISELNQEDLDDFDTIYKFLKFRRENKKSKSSAYIASTESAIETTKEESTVYLPILGQAAAGKPIEIIEVYEGELKVNGTHDKSNSFIIRANGESMIGANINDGDLVIFRTQPTVENGEIALVNVEGEATIKYFYLNNGICELHSANPAYPPMKYTSGDIKVLGKFVEVIEKR